MSSSHLVAIVVTVSLCLPVLGADKAEKKARKRAAQRGPITKVEKQVAELDLSEEQKQKVSAVLDTYRKKFADVEDPAAKLTKEQRQAKKEATENAKAQGKKGKELRQEVEAAANLTDEQKKAQQQTAARSKELQTALKKDLASVLNPEQIAKLGLETKKKKKNS